MGANTELFYFWKQEETDVISFLKKSNLKALVLPKNKNWITVLPDNEFAHPPEDFLKLYKGALVQFKKVSSAAEGEN